jgi:hypothetical protein
MIAGMKNAPPDVLDGRAGDELPSGRSPQWMPIDCATNPVGGELVDRSVPAIGILAIHLRAHDENAPWPNALTSRSHFDGWRHGFHPTSLVWLWITPWIALDSVLARHRPQRGYRWWPTCGMI